MSVQVVKETDPNLLSLGIEKCVKCDTETLYWWANGCMPLCPSCAKTVTREWCIQFASENKYGPLPSKQYRDRRKNPDTKSLQI